MVFVKSSSVNAVSACAPTAHKATNTHSAHPARLPRPDHLVCIPLYAGAIPNVAGLRPGPDQPPGCHTLAFDVASCVASYVAGAHANASKASNRQPGGDDGHEDEKILARTLLATSQLNDASIHPLPVSSRASARKQGA